MVLEWIVYVGQVGVIVVIEGGEDVVGQVLVGVVHSIVHHRYVDAGACVCGPRLLHPDVLTCAVAKLVVIVQVPLASVERVVYACAPGNVGAAVYKNGLPGIHDGPHGVTSCLCAIPRHLQMVCARVQSALEDTQVAEVNRIYWGREVVFIGQIAADLNAFAHSTDGHVRCLFEGKAEEEEVVSRVYDSACCAAEDQRLSVSLRRRRLLWLCMIFTIGRWIASPIRR